MPARITARTLRLTVCKLLLEVMRGAAEQYLKADNFGTHADEVLLCCAILVGQLEQRPMTAAKLAHYAGMPRPTVVRKLRSLAARGLVVMDGGTAVLPVEKVNALTPTFVGRLTEPSLHRIAAEMSKMDNKPVARDDSGT